MTITEATASAVAGPSTTLELKLNGSVYDTLTPLRAEVETSLRMPAMATIWFNDDDLNNGALDLRLDADVELTITAGDDSPNSGTPFTFRGRIATIEAHREANQAATVIRCFDAMTKLYGARQTKTYLQKKYADIVNELASANGLSRGTIDSAGPVHPLVIQYEESDGEFLERLAAECGYLLHLDSESRLSFDRMPELTKATRIPDVGHAGGTQLVMGDDLTSYEVTYGPKPPVTRVRTFGWDPMAKEKVEGEADVATGRATFEFDQWRPPESGGDFVLSTVPALTMRAANEIAVGVADQICASGGALRGRIMGNPCLAAGVEIAVGPASHAFAGWYRITSARQVFESGHLRTEFACDGFGDRGLRVAGGSAQPSAADPPNTVPWVTTGIVTNISDTQDKMGRVKVKLPGLGLDDGETDWLRVVAPGNGHRRGTWWLPEVNDEVLVAFERGDLRHGYVLGGVHNGLDLPSELLADQPTTPDGSVKHRAFTTKTGHQLVFSDEAGSEAIELHTGDTKLVMNFDQEAGAISFTVYRDSSDDRLQERDAESHASIVLTKDGDITIIGANNITVEATETIALKGRSIELEAQQDISMKGNNIKNEAQMNFEAKGSTSAKVEGALLTLTGQSLAELSAGMVKIN